MDPRPEETFRPVVIYPEEDDSPSPPSPVFSGPRVWIHVVLFLATLFTTLLAGSIQQGVNPFSQPRGWILGIPFSFTLMAILLTHEMGHYLTSRWHGVAASLPYFIPAPSFIGTFGAFIRMTSPIMQKRALLDIGASGPIAGFVLSIAAVAVGLRYSTVLEADVNFPGIGLGSPLIFSLLSHLVIGPVEEGYDVLLHPVAFAGWIGLFVTALNLIPIGQLDGGHVAYAVFGHRHRIISILMIPALLILGYLYWPGWYLWAVLPLIFGINHPPTRDAPYPIDRRRRRIGWLCLITCILCFTPHPFIM
jgi:membrane-associated protease RseP (regulator of RpoE activity)